MEPGFFSWNKGSLTKPKQTLKKNTDNEECLSFFCLKERLQCLAEFITEVKSKNLITIFQEYLPEIQGAFH